MEVLVEVEARQGAGPDLETAYRFLTPLLLSAAAGLNHSALARSRSRPHRYLLLSHWQSEQEYRLWEADPAHRRLLRPLVEHTAQLTAHPCTQVWPLVRAGGGEPCG